MISQLTDIAELCFTTTDDVPRVQIRYAGCNIMVVDDDDIVWHLEVDQIDGELYVLGKPSILVVCAIMRSAKGFIAFRA